MTPVETLWRIALTLKARAGSRKGRNRLPPLLFFTDPGRTPDIAAVMRTLPRGAGVVWRPFGAPDAIPEGRRLADLARQHGLIFLAGADPALARAIRAHGLHLPERLAGQARSLKRRHPRWLVTAAAHSRLALRRARWADASIVSPLFPSRSASAGRPLGPLRFADWVRNAGGPVYALGGLNGATARRLLGSGASGLAAVEALTLQLPIIPAKTGTRVF